MSSLLYTTQVTLITNKKTTVTQLTILQYTCDNSVKTKPKKVLSKNNNNHFQ